MTEVSADGARLVIEVLDKLVTDHPPASSSPTDFLGARYDAGLAWVHFDRGFGGLGLPASLQPLINRTLAAADASVANANYVGVHQAAAAVHAFASDELKHRWLRPAFTNEEYWCQLFSEPGAGSDLAGLGTAAVRDHEEWTVSGQKVWTSFAHVARWGILLARTDPDVPKHRGLTFFVLDMQADGIDVRPLRTIDGGRHFNEVFLTGVRIPDRYRLGEVGQGWSVSQHMLSTEREGITEHESLSPWLLQVWKSRRYLGDLEALYRDRVAAAYVADEICHLLVSRAKQAQGQQGPDVFAPVVKVVRNMVDQRIANLVVDLLGPEGTLGGEYDWQVRHHEPTNQMRFLRSRAFTIGGGTAQVMRNLIGERLLGLPGEPRADKDLPWSQMRRS
jgi:alkylation response protein AidB-like acyl-CoA dehydrogenase